MITFGNIESYKIVPKREAAYGILFNAQDEIAVVHTSRGYFLPGGGIEAGESHEACLIREFQEELGFIVNVNDFISSGTLIGYAPGKSRILEMVGHNYYVSDTGERTSVQELDHALVWLPLQEARTKLRLTHQAWAIEQLLKNRKPETLCDYNSHWKTWFDTLESVFQKALGEHIIAIKHVGNTSIEGMRAKPIIDINLVMESDASFDKLKQGLEGFGYEHCGDFGIYEREAFKRNPMNMKTTPILKSLGGVTVDDIELLDEIPHHLYVCPKESSGIVDLHMHTTASDGTSTPEVLMAEILLKRIALFSVTDHDSVANIDELAALAKANAVDFIPGVEVSVLYEGKELHILTYGIHTFDEALLDVLRHNQAVREAHNKALVAFAFARQGSGNSVDDCLYGYEQYIHDATRGGWKSLNYLMDHGIVTSLPDFFSLMDAFGAPLVFKSYDEVIPKLNALGYLTVLAHPPAYYGGEKLPVEMLDTLVVAGIQGIECYSPYYKTHDDATYYLNYCKEKDLVITCGSDYHGAFIQSRKLALPLKTTRDVSYERLREFIQK